MTALRRSGTDDDYRTLQAAGAGCDAIACTLRRLGSRTSAPNRAELLDMADELGRKFVTLTRQLGR